MFGKKKEVRKRAKAGKGLSQYGLFDIPGENDFDDMENVDDDDDDDLEAELLAITSGKAPRKPKKAARPAPVIPDLDVMVAQSLKDIPSDEELSADENDPDLLEELSALQEVDDVEEEKAPAPETPKSPAAEVSLTALLEERLKMYQEAEKNAKVAGESSRARRFGRGIKTLNDMLKQARSGRNVNEADIPPPVSTVAGKRPDPPSTSVAAVPEEPSSPAEPTADVLVPTRPAPTPDIPVPTRPAPPPPIQPAAEETAAASDEQNESLQILKENQSQYKQAAVKAKRAGNTELALQYVKVAKQFDVVIAALLEGKPVDLSSMPPPPSELAAVTSESSEQKEDAEKQQSSEPAGTEEPAPEAQPETGAEVDIFQAPPPPATVMEALEQRLAKYRSAEQAAKEEGNSSKARRMGRIVKQYENAIKLHRAGKPIPVDELPTPPGFAPIPVEGASTSTSTPAPAPVAPSPKPSAEPAPAVEPTGSDETKPVPSTSPKTPISPPEKVNVRKTPQSRQEKQLTFLVARQKEFKEAAIEAKKKGEINQAKEYLRLAKGFDPLIEASRSGLPVDMDTLPVPPGTKVLLESDFDFVTVDDCIPGSDAEIFEKLEEDLLKQAKMCLATRDHFKAIGDVASANRFEKLAIHSKKDLDAVRVAHKRSEPLPKFHYEMRSFSVVQCCTDLTDNELELIIIQGINYNVPNPKEVDTYVKFEFPYPTEDPPKDRTSLVKDTNNPEYNATFKLPIQRNVRACQRVFKRHSIKLEVWSRGWFPHAWLCSPCCCRGASSDRSTKKPRGFFRGDSLIGTAYVKLLPLETKCEIHDSFDLMDGRKPVGGKLEVKVRIRNPILTKQVEQIQEKWLVIDGF